MSEAGTFCWHDIVTNDKAKALKFYTDVFGWKTEEKDMGNGNKYTFLIHSSGKQVGGCSESKDQNPHWLPYILVTSLEETSKLATGKGAKQHGNVMEIAKFGSMAVLEDPFGMFFALWQEAPKQESESSTETKKKGRGGRKKAEVPYESIWAWHEFSGSKPEEIAAWYGGIFGWDSVESKMGNGDTYRMIGLKGKMPHSGVYELKEGGFITSYIAVENVDGVTEAAKNAGATIVKEPADIIGAEDKNMGRFSIIKDPCGALFAVHSGPKVTGKKRKAPKAKAAPKKKKAKKDDDYDPSDD